MHDLLRLIFRIGKRLVLPWFGEKGNILTSVLTLFSETAGVLIGFRRDILRLPFPTMQIPTHQRLDVWWVTCKFWLRKSMVAAVWALFILSSFEWSSVPPSPVSRVESLTSVQESPDADNRDIRDCRTGDAEPRYILPYAGRPGTLVLIGRRQIMRRWLMVGNMRI